MTVLPEWLRLLLSQWGWVLVLFVLLELAVWRLNKPNLEEGLYVLFLLPAVGFIVGMFTNQFDRTQTTVLALGPVLVLYILKIHIWGIFYKVPMGTAPTE